VTSIGDYAFCGCSVLTDAYFYGNAPTMGVWVFASCASGFTVNYLNTSTGYTNPWYGNTTAIIEPIVTPTLTSTPSPTPAADVLGANLTATPTAAPTTGVLGAAKTGETNNQMTVLIGIVLLISFAAVGTVFVIKRKKDKD